MAPGEDGTVSVSPETIAKAGIANVKVVAENGYHSSTYRFLYEYPDGSHPYFGIDESTRKTAESMLSGWKDYIASAPRDYTSEGGNDKYWSVYRMLATGLSLDDSYVYDLTKHNYEWPSDYAAAVIMLSMIGENPYDFNGRNMVQELADKQMNGLFGAYANNIWAYMAFKTAGYEYEYMDKLTETVKEQAARRTSDMSWSLDMSAWAMAVAGDQFSAEEIADWAEWMRESCLHTSGDEAGIFQDVYYRIPNSNTHGTILTALNALNIDPERHYTVAEGKSPLQTMKDVYLMEDGRFHYNAESTYADSYNKDAIIGLGDIVMGSNVWNRAMPGQTDLEQLLKKAEPLLGKGTQAQNETLQRAYDAALKVEDVTKSGRAYYDLLSAAKKLDPSLAPKNVRMCSVAQGAEIDALIAAIGGLKEEPVSSDRGTLDSLLSRYNALENDVQRGYVTNYDKLQLAIKKLDEAEKKQPAKEPAAAPAETAVPDITYKAKAKSVQLTWKKEDAASGYTVFIYDAKAKKYKKIADVKAPNTSYTVKRSGGSKGAKLKESTVYKFKVVAYVKQDGKKQTLSSKKITASTKLAKTSLKKISTSGKKVKLSWKKAKGISGYEVWMKTAESEGFQLVKRVKGAGRTALTYRKAKKKTTCSFKVRTFKTAGKERVYGAFSNVKKVKIR